MVLFSELGPALRDLRERQRRTQDEVADAAEITAASLSRIENGKMVPSLGVVDRILTTLGVELDDLVFMARRLAVERVRENLEREPEGEGAGRLHRQASLCLAEGVLNLAQFLNLTARLELQMGRGDGEEGEGDQVGGEE